MAEELLRASLNGKNLKLIILAGAGISIDGPSNLPSGQELTNYYMECSFGKPIADCITRRWSAITKAVCEATGMWLPFLRLESIVEKIDDVDKEFNCPRLLTGFNYFQDALPNHLHRHIASLVKCGAVVITPNFDCAIERAILDQAIEESEACRVSFPVFDNATKLYVGARPKYSVYHYHGIGSDPEKLGVTVARIRRGFSSGFTDKLQCMLKEGYSLLCVGFSCSDFFDATQFFDSLDPSSCNGMGMFVNHMSDASNGISPIPEYSLESQKRFIGAFKRRLIVVGPTAQLLYDLVCKVCGTQEASNNCDNVLSDSSKNPKKWKSSFNSFASLSDAIRPFRLIRLLNQFGFYLTDHEIAEINRVKRSQTPSLFDGCTTMCDFVERVARDFLYYLNQHGSADNYFLEKERLSLPNRSVGFDIRMISQDIGYISPSAQKVVHLYNQAMEKDCSAKPHFGQIPAVVLPEVANEVKRCSCGRSELFGTEHIISFMKMYKQILKNAFEKGLDSDTRHLMEKTDRVAASIMELPLRAFLFSSHLISIMKAHCVMRAFLEGKGPDVFVNKIVELAMQISFSDEILRIYKTAALADLACLMRFRSNIGTASPCQEDIIADLRKRYNDMKAFLGVFPFRKAWQTACGWLCAIEALMKLKVIQKEDLRKTAMALLK